MSTQPNQDNRYTFDRVVRILITVGTITALVVLLRYLSDVLLPFAAAVVLAYLLNPVVTKLEKTLKRRNLAVAITLGGLALLGVVLVLIIVPLMLNQLSGFESSLSHLKADLGGALVVDPEGQTPTTPPTLAPSAISATPTIVPSAPPTSQPDEGSSLGLSELAKGWEIFRQDKGKVPRQERLQALMKSVSGTHVGTLIEHTAVFVRTQEFRELLLNAVKRVALGGITVINVAVQMALGATVFVVILIYLVFLLMDFPEYARTWPSFLPPKYRDSIVEFLVEFDVALRRYFRGQFIVALSVGVLFAIGFSLIGLPMAIPFGLFIGALNMVPYLQIAGLVPAAILAIIRSIESGSSLGASLLLVLLVFAVIQIIQDAVITPRVMGKATGLRPIAILLGIFIWGKLLGFLGLILAIPLTCLGIAYYRRFVLNPQQSATSVKHAHPPG